MNESRTHYSYLSGPNGMREPTGLYDLTHATPHARRKLIEHLMKNGELLAICPFGVTFKTMKELREALIWLESEEVFRCKFCGNRFSDQDKAKGEYCCELCRDLDKEPNHES